MVVKRFILLTEFYFLVEICLCLEYIIISNSLILGTYWDCTHESETASYQFYPVVYADIHL